MTSRQPRRTMKEIRAAYSRLSDWLYSDGQNWDQRETDLDTLLTFLAKQLAPKKARNGRSVSQRGYRYENELRLEFIEHGLRCRRVPLSGAGSDKDDLVVTTGWDQDLRGEAKIRKTLPAYLINDGCDFTVFRRDHGQSLVLISLDLFKELCQ